ncbi:phage antirepressor protein [Microgenomates group bacterium RBG_16_45_19]|nr:MAG: phage antirepressor protein [Microgenomates group bacterium RBG_16_45_19]
MNPSSLIPDTKIAVFRQKQIRRIIFQYEWWFSVVDICAALTASVDASAYWRKLKQRLTEEGSEVVTFCHGLKLEASDGKKYTTDCANTEGIFRIIQSIPSLKAEPFKRWLARVGYERVQEIEDPELGTKRTRALYKAKGYPSGWIEKRMRGIAIREDLTEEWSERGAKSQLDYAILTNDIMTGAFGLTVAQYKKLKSLKRENLRDHMVDLELILTLLGEATTTQLTRDRNAQGMSKLTRDAQEGGAVAGNARRDIERRGTKVISSTNYTPKSKRLKT